MVEPTPTHVPLVLIIRDGWGRNPHPEHDAFNAVRLAQTPVADRLEAQWPTTLVRTSGRAVGLLADTMGNSEVGHQNIGAGRIVKQDALRIAEAIEDGSFSRNEALLGAFRHAERTGGRVHLLGLVSDGQVHSDIRHLFALIDLAVRERFSGDRLFVHAITDGRDTPPTSGAGFVGEVEDKLLESGVGTVASVIGRYFAMDRDYRWDRVAKAYRALTGRGVAEPPATFPLARQAVQAYYNQPAEPSRTGDEFITPTQIADEADGIQPRGLISDGDAVIFFNFRGDRPRELTRAFVLDDEQWAAVPQDGFDRGPRINDLYFCTLTNYEKDLRVSAVAFPKPPRMVNILGEAISSRGLTQFRCAETEKYPHVTFFFNDYRDEPFEGERRQIIQSPQDVSTYDQKPEMSAPGVRDAVLARLAADDCEALIVVNFANGDMVGHSGNLKATIRAIEVVDQGVGAIVDAALERGGSLIVTSDHGNAEQMWDPEHDCPHTAHTLYDVPLTVVGRPFRHAALREGGALCDIAPTILRMMELDQPTEMAGASLLA